MIQCLMKSGDGQFMVSSGPVIYDSVYNGKYAIQGLLMKVGILLISI